MQIHLCKAAFGNLNPSVPRRFGCSLLLLSVMATSQVYGGDKDPAADGQRIYDKSCAKCHDPGMGAFFSGAPRIGTDAWQTRLSAAGSVDALVASASRGKGKMPAQGGTSGLADTDLKAAIEYILSKSGH